MTKKKMENQSSNHNNWTMNKDVEQRRGRTSPFIDFIFF